MIVGHPYVQPRDEQERQHKWNELCMTGKFKGLLTGKTKDNLKDIAQALGLKLDGKSHKFINRIN